MFPRYRLSVTKCKIFNCSLYDLFDNSETFVIALICQHLFPFWLPYTLLAYSKWDLTNDLYRVTQQFLKVWAKRLLIMHNII